MVEVEHDHTWFLYFLCDGEDGEHKVWADPFYPEPEYFSYGYECICGATPPGVAP